MCSGFLPFFLHLVPSSGDGSAGKEADRYSVSITASGIGPRAYYREEGRGYFPRRVIRPLSGDDHKCDRSDRAVRLRLNGCRSGKYREVESSPSLRSIAAAAIARDPTRFSQAALSRQHRRKYASYSETGFAV